MSKRRFAAPDPQGSPRGRGASVNPRNRFETLNVEWEPGERASSRTRYLVDSSRSIVANNDSPDIGFEISLNPYRGCEHGCAYCYARSFHEYLGFSAGLDFETRILVKPEAARLLRDTLSKPGWEPKLLALSGVTDPYQPIERKLEITRDCLAVLAEARHPTGLITKNRLITRDLDHLGELASHDAVHAVLSVTSLDGELSRRLEPRASAPRARLAAIRELAEAGIPVGVNVAPIIPGLTDHEVPAILEAAAEAGASFARYTVVRLPLAVAEVFSAWLDEHYPDGKAKVLSRVRSMRGGRLNTPSFDARMHAEGRWAEQIRGLFHVHARRVGLDGPIPSLSVDAFRAPEGAQRRLFG